MHFRYTCNLRYLQVDEERGVSVDDFDISAQTGALSVQQSEELTSAEIREAYSINAAGKA